MFFISAFKDNKYGVTDTRDRVTEWYSLEQLKEITARGIQIKGISAKGIPYCKSDNILNDFMVSIKPRLAKLRLVGINDRSAITNDIINFAMECGIIAFKDHLVIDISNEKVLLKGYYNTILDYSDKQVIDKVDVCDKYVTKLSRLGIEAFNYITLSLKDGTIITLADIVSKMCYLFSFDASKIRYIGITPSNKMFKFFIGYDKVVSVKVDTADYIISNKDKILSIKTEQFFNFKSYIRSFGNSPDRWGISKMSIKPYTNMYGLKQKYPTLHDVYVSEKAF